MERKILNYDEKSHNLHREFIEINKVGETIIEVDKFYDKGYYSGPWIDNFNEPFILNDMNILDIRRYVEGEFTEACDKYEMNFRPCVQVITDSETGNHIKFKVTGYRPKPDEYYRLIDNFGEDVIYSTFDERYPDGHGDWLFEDFLYDINGNIIRDANGNPIKWSYRYDKYIYFFEEMK